MNTLFKTIRNSLSVGFLLLIIAVNSPYSMAQENAAENISESPTRTIEFSDCTWYVKSGYYGPGPNYWSNSEESVWLDQQGRLHLKIRKIGSRWYCAEVYTPQYTTYGEHRFLVEGNLAQLDQNVVLGLFTYADDAHEIDIEYSKWGDPNFQKIGSFTVQPWTVQGNTERFSVNQDSLRTSHSFIWQENFVLFSSYQGHYAGLLPSPEFLIHKWIYWGDYIPKNSHHLRTHLNFWLVDGKSPLDTTNLEIMITKVIQPLSTGIECQEPQHKIPVEFKLFQNYPNPFARTTMIHYWLTKSDFITIDIFDLLGRKVDTLVNSLNTAADHTVTYHPDYLPCGIYYYRIQGKNFSQVKKMILSR